MVREGQAIHGGQQVFDGHLKQGREVVASDVDKVRVLAQAGAMAVGTNRPSPVAADHHPVLDFVALGFETGEKGMDSLEMRASIPNKRLLFFGQIVPWGMDRQAGLGGPHDHLVAPASGSFAPPRRNGVVVQASCRVRHNLVGIDAQNMSIPLACGARPHRTVEAKHVRGRFLEGEAIALESVVEHERTQVVVRGLVVNDALASPFEERGLDAVGEATWVFGNAFHGKSINQKAFNGSFHAVFHAHHAFSGPNPCIPLLLQDPQVVFLRAPFGQVPRRHHKHPAFSQRRHRVNDVVHGVFFHGLPADGRPGRADPCEQDLQVVVDFRPRPYGASRAPRRRPLLDGDGGGEAVNGVDVRLVQTTQELSGVTAEAFDVAPLAFRIQRVKSQGAFARSAEPGDDGQFFLWNADVHRFQVVGTRAFDVDVHCSF